MVVASALTVALGIAAALHALWAFRIWFPLGDEALLARAVVGTKAIVRMPGPFACMAVVVLLGVVVLLVWWPEGALRDAALGLAALGFIARGAVSWTPVMDRFCPEEPFRRLNRRFYGPLILAMGMGLAALAVV